MDVGSNIKKIRKSKGITQVVLSEKTGIPYRTIQDYENNKIKEPSMSKLALISEQLGVTLGELTGETEVLKKELRLKDLITSEKSVLNDIDTLLGELHEIESLIKNENDPEILRTLPQKFSGIQNHLQFWHSISKNMGNEINALCKDLGTDKNNFIKENPIDEEKLNYIELLKTANKQVDSLLKESHKDEDRIFEKIVAGDLECFQRLFSDYDLVFFCEAIDVLINLKILTQKENKPYIPLGMKNLRRSLKIFFSNEKIDIEPELIDELFEELSNGFALPPAK